MSFLTRLRLRWALRRANYDLAAALRVEAFGGGAVKKELAAAFDAFLKDRCHATALAVIDVAPEMLRIFLWSAPGRQGEVLLRARQRLNAQAAAEEGEHRGTSRM